MAELVADEHRGAGGVHGTERGGPSVRGRLDGVAVGDGRQGGHPVAERFRTGVQTERGFESLAQGVRKVGTAILRFRVGIAHG